MPLGTGARWLASRIDAGGPIAISRAADRLGPLRLHACGVPIDTAWIGFGGTPVGPGLPIGLSGAEEGVLHIDASRIFARLWEYRHDEAHPRQVQDRPPSRPEAVGPGQEPAQQA